MNTVRMLNYRDSDLANGGAFDLSKATTQWIIPCRGFTQARVDARGSMNSAAWSAGTVTVKHSADGFSPNDFDTPVVLTNTDPASGQIDLGATGFLIIEPGTTEASVNLEISVVLSWTKTA